jgi:hypothetical protein
MKPACQIRRIVADTNREVRFGLNSSAFGAGRYEIKLEAITTRTEVGWVLLELRKWFSTGRKFRSSSLSLIAAPG